MLSRTDGSYLRQIERLFEEGRASDLSEWQLLERYVSRRDEALLARHGPMVLGVCRRVLGNSHEVDDAFQATFLVLVKKARSLGEKDAIGHWLYGVAYRVALRSRSLAARRRSLDPNVEPPDESTGDELLRRELAPLLEEELNRLPVKYRAPIVLCYAEGLTQEAAAIQLHWPIGTVKGRLARARTLLKSRLARRGLAPMAGTLTASLSRDASARLPQHLVDATIRNGLTLISGSLATQTIPASLATLLQGALMAMSISPMKTAALTLTVLVLTIAGTGVVARQAQDGQGSAVATKASQPDQSGPPEGPREPSSTPPQQQAKAAEEAGKKYTELDGKLQDNTQKYLAEQVLNDEFRRFEGGEQAEVSEIVLWSKRVLDHSSTTAAAKAEAHKTHLKRMERLVDVAEKRAKSGQLASAELSRARFYRNEAEDLLERPDPLPRPNIAGSLSDYIPVARRDRISRRLIEVLEQPIDMSFPNETPFEEVLKYIKVATTSPRLPHGIPFYVDPEGLQKAEKTMSSPVTLDLSEVPIKATLNLVLKQLGMCYIVKDGMVIMTHEHEEPMSSTMLDLVESAERGELSNEEMQALAEKLKMIGEIRKLAHPEAEKAAPKTP